MDINEVIKRPEYEFLYQDEHLENIAFLVFGGSHSYGTNIEGSDIDIRGCTMDRPSDLIGLSSFEQIINNGTDTTIYGFSKFINLLIDCNPNIVEMLGCKPEHYAMVSETGRALIDNRKMFLSQRAIRSFSGYAFQQLNRLNNAIARDSLPQPEKERHIQAACESALANINGRYQEFPEGSITLSVGPSEKEDLEEELLMNVSLLNYPVRDYKNIWSDLNTIVKNYGSLNKRNDKKDAAHLAKHSMHLVRLYLTAIDLLELGDIVTNREKDLELLMSIRREEYLTEGMLLRPEFNELLCWLKQRLDYAIKNTSLPKEPDLKRINEFVMAQNRKVILAA